MKTLILATTALFLTAPAIAQEAATIALPSIETMNGGQILEVARGNTTFGTFADRAVSFAVYLAADGRMIGRITEGGEHRIETGAWRVENDRLLGRWDAMRGGNWSAFEYRPAGEAIHAYREDGTLDRIQYYVAGDPLNLASSTEGSAPRTDTAALIHQRTLAATAAWSPGSGVFSIDAVAPFYVQDERLLAYDQTSPSTTVIRGVEQWREIWTPSWLASQTGISRQFPKSRSALGGTLPSRHSSSMSVVRSLRTDPVSRREAMLHGSGSVMVMNG